MHMAAPTLKVQSILWPMLEDGHDTRSISEENDSMVAQSQPSVLEVEEAESEYILGKST